MMTTINDDEKWQELFMEVGPCDLKKVAEFHSIVSYLRIWSFQGQEQTRAAGIKRETKAIKKVTTEL